LIRDLLPSELHHPEDPGSSLTSRPGIPARTAPLPGRAEPYQGPPTAFAHRLLLVLFQKEFPSDKKRPLHNSILANFIRFFIMKSMVNSQIFARMRVMQRSQEVRSLINDDDFVKIAGRQIV
jgi:hypothetical protein